MSDVDKANAKARSEAIKRGRLTYSREVVDYWPACVECGDPIKGWDRYRKCGCPGREWETTPGHPGWSIRREQP